MCVCVHVCACVRAQPRPTEEVFTSPLSASFPRQPSQIALLQKGMCSLAGPARPPLPGLTNLATRQRAPGTRGEAAVQPGSAGLRPGFLSLRLGSRARVKLSKPAGQIEECPGGASPCPPPGHAAVPEQEGEEEGQRAPGAQGLREPCGFPAARPGGRWTCLPVGPAAWSPASGSTALTRARNAGPCDSAKRKPENLLSVTLHTF